MSTGKKYIHEVHSNEKVPQLVIYEVTDNDDAGSRVLIGTIEKLRDFMKDRINMRDDETMTPEQLDEDMVLWDYVEEWGYTAIEVAVVYLTDF